MDIQQRGILTLIQSAVTGQGGSLPPEFDMAAAFPELLRHQVAAMGYAGGMLCGLSRTDPTMQQLFQQYILALRRSEKQMKAAGKLFAAFEEAGVDYLPLKGTMLKAMYPKPELRAMGDADILIRPAQYDKIRPIMETLGFTACQENEYELPWKSEALFVELHKQIMGSNNADYYRYLGDVWQRAVLLEGSRYGMCREDTYVYIFLHYAKHYRNGGIGLRQLTDLWILGRAWPDLDMDYIRQAMETIRVWDFFQNTLAMLGAWFENGPEDDKTRLMTDYIFANGCFGTIATRHAAIGLRREREAGSRSGGKLRGYLQILFPSVDWMANRYPVLKKAPWLLPVFWPVRWVTAVLFRRDNVGNYRRDLKAESTDKVDAFEQSLQFVGLDFHF